MKPRVCPDCGKPLPPRARYCDQCRTERRKQTNCQNVKEWRQKLKVVAVVVEDIPQPQRYQERNPFLTINSQRPEPDWRKWVYGGQKDLKK